MPMVKISSVDVCVNPLRKTLCKRPGCVYPFGPRKSLHRQLLKLNSEAFRQGQQIGQMAALAQRGDLKSEISRSGGAEPGNLQAKREKKGTSV